VDKRQIEAIATKVAKEFIEDTDDMQAHVLCEIIEALERGEDVYDGLANAIFTEPFMERFINELLKYEE
jgi:hypothetical protein